MPKAEARQAYDNSGNPIPALPVGTLLGSTIAVDGTSKQSSAAAKSGVVKLYYDSGDDFCHIAVGDNPTATVNSEPLGSKGFGEHFHIEEGQKIAATKSATGGGGTLYIIEKP